MPAPWLFLAVDLSVNAYGAPGSPAVFCSPVQVWRRWKAISLGGGTWPAQLGQKQKRMFVRKVVQDVINKAC